MGTEDEAGSTFLPMIAGDVGLGRQLQQLGAVGGLEAVGSAMAAPSALA